MCSYWGTVQGESVQGWGWMSGMLLNNLTSGADGFRSPFITVISHHTNSGGTARIQRLRRGRREQIELVASSY